MDTKQDDRWRDVVPASDKRRQAGEHWRELREQATYVRSLLDDAPLSLERGQIVGKLGALYNCGQAISNIAAKLLNLAGVDEIPAGPDIGRKTRP